MSEIELNIENMIVLAWRIANDETVLTGRFGEKPLYTGSEKVAAMRLVGELKEWLKSSKKKDIDTTPFKELMLKQKEIENDAKDIAGLSR